MMTEWICTQVDASSTECVVTASSTPAGYSTSSVLYVQDSGNVSLGLSIIIVMMSIALVAYFFNSIKSKKPWR